jgi:hypothetical protein
MSPSKCAIAGTLIVTSVALLPGCAPVLTVLGVGGASAVNHTLSGIAYKTFTEPLPRVRAASIGALGRMGLKLDSARSDGGNDVVTAGGKDREIEIVLEPISASTTRIRVIARSGTIFYDSATASEIIVQTERALARMRDET